MRDTGKPRRRKLDEEERVLWRRVTRSVTPLDPTRTQHDPLTPEAPERAGEPTEKAPAGKGARKASPPRPARSPRALPLDRRVKQRLARGSEPIEARLDLHGRSQSDAHAALAQFLRRQQARGARFVLVITGKGGRTDEFASERGVLKRQVPMWLRQPEFAAFVTGFTEAHAAHGGAGALYVRLRRPARAG